MSSFFPIYCWLALKNCKKKMFEYTKGEKWIADFQQRELSNMQKKMSQNFYNSNALKLFGVAFFLSILQWNSLKENFICVIAKKKFYFFAYSINWHYSRWIEGEQKDSEIKECWTTPSCKTGRLLRDFVLLFLFHAICVFSRKTNQFSAGETQTTQFLMRQVIEMLVQIIIFILISVDNGRANKSDVIQ